MPRTETPAVDLTSRVVSSTVDPTSNDHWMRRVSIMTLLSGIGAIACGHNIAKLDETLGHQIAFGGIGVAIGGAFMWLVTHLILKGSRN